MNCYRIGQLYEALHISRKGGLTESQNLGLFRFILLLLISKDQQEIFCLRREDASFLLAQTKELSNSLLRHSMQFEAFLYDEEPSFEQK